MTTATIPRRTLENGDVMDAAEFRRRYEASDLQHVELIEGVVFLPSKRPVFGHGVEHALAVFWLGAYAMNHDESAVALGQSTVWMDERNVPEPDAMLIRRTEGNRGNDDCLTEMPSLIFEIAVSSVSRDLHQKKAAYERNGVREYIVWRVEDAEIDWFQLREGRYQLRTPDAAGIIESEVFPGLRLPVAALLARDRAALVAQILLTHTTLARVLRWGLAVVVLARQEAAGPLGVRVRRLRAGVRAIGGAYTH